MNWRRWCPRANTILYDLLVRPITNKSGAREVAKNWKGRDAYCTIMENLQTKNTKVHLSKPKWIERVLMPKKRHPFSMRPCSAGGRGAVNAPL
jgi:hypothetical protein